MCDPVNSESVPLAPASFVQVPPLDKSRFTVASLFNTVPIKEESPLLSAKAMTESFFSPFCA